MEIDRQDGSVRLPNGFAFGAGLTQDDFRASAAFQVAKTQNYGTLPWIHYSFPGGAIDSRAVLVSLCFYDQMLVSVDLAADLYPPGPKSWDTYSLEIEAATKDFHDRLLKYLFAGSTRGKNFHGGELSKDEAILQRPANWSFPWGTVCSSHDSKGGGTSITISYGNRHAEAVQMFKRRG
jgi:hypothetical protein